MDHSLFLDLEMFKSFSLSSSSSLEFCSRITKTRSFLKFFDQAMNYCRTRRTGQEMATCPSSEEVASVKYPVRTVSDWSLIHSGYFLLRSLMSTAANLSSLSAGVFREPCPSRLSKW
jgi:hypothetical protein